MQPWNYRIENPVTSTALDPVNAAQVTHTQKPHSRDNSKQAQVIAMLNRPE
jgi:hypothetical protein